MSKKKKKKSTIKRRWFSRLLLRFLLLIDILLLISLLQVFIYTIFNPPLTPLMVQRWHEGVGWKYTWKPLQEISPVLQQAVMAAEDQRFTEHHGFDLIEIQNALDNFQSGNKLRGASTISMQVARNLFLWQGRNWLRKGLEAYYTVLIEFFMPKWRIMELYLNIAEWGKGVFGAEQAAFYHFYGQAKDLTDEQAAFLAAILPSPCRWSASKPTEYIKQRQQSILEQMPSFKPLRKKSFTKATQKNNNRSKVQSSEIRGSGIIESLNFLTLNGELRTCEHQRKRALKTMLLTEGLFLIFL